jgi:hypothetical protein
MQNRKHHAHEFDDLLYAQERLARVWTYQGWQTPLASAA